MRGGGQAGEDDWRPPQPVGETRPPRGALRGRIFAEYRGVFSPSGETFTPVDDPTEIVRGDDDMMQYMRASSVAPESFLGETPPTNLPGATAESPIEADLMAWMVKSAPLEKLRTTDSSSPICCHFLFWSCSRN